MQWIRRGGSDSSNVQHHSVHKRACRTYSQRTSRSDVSTFLHRKSAAEVSESDASCSRLVYIVTNWQRPTHRCSKDWRTPAGMKWKLENCAAGDYSHIKQFVCAVLCCIVFSLKWSRATAISRRLIICLSLTSFELNSHSVLFTLPVLKSEKKFTCRLSETNL